MKTSLPILICSMLMFMVSTALAVPTQVTVNVKSKGAKFMGTSMGGVLITIRDVGTGELLAKGVTSGGTGNTDLIMNAKRGMPISDPGSAKFTATIDISEPTYVEVKAYGPLSQRQAANTVSLTQWLIPGKNITGGDALLIEIPGLAVNVLSPSSQSFFPFKANTTSIDIRANVTMVCGCPLTAGGLWDANKFEVSALVLKDGKQIGQVPLRYADKPNHFSGALDIREPGLYDITVYAFDPADGNTGIDRVTFVVN